MVDQLKSKTYFFDGRKSILLEQYPDDAWTWLSNGPESSEADYYKLIPTLFRAVQLRSYAVSSMPFQIRKGNSEEPFDASEDWQNKVGFLPNPFQLLQLVESALVMAGRAYLYNIRSQASPKQLRYLVPSSVRPQIDAEKGLVGFKRPVNGVEKDFKIEDIIYFWLPDPYVEVGPPKNYPAKAAANACGVLLNVDVFASQYFDRGAIKAMLLTVKGIPVESERQKLETWWKNVVSGIKNAFGSHVVNAESVTPVIVGEGMKELENTTLNQEKREDISIATGIPMSILFADAANYATSQQDELNYLNNTIIPECVFIASVLNDQIFTKMGMKFEFLPDTLDAFSADENERSASLKQLTDAGIPLLMAMDILGFELTEEQRKELEEAEEEKEKREQEMAENMAKPPEQGENDNNAPNVPRNGNNGDNTRSALRKWERFALRKLNEGKKASAEFIHNDIPAALAGAIMGALDEAQNSDDVKRTFDDALIWGDYPGGIKKKQLKYDPDQPRDENGRWTDGGGGGAGGAISGGGGGAGGAISGGAGANMTDHFKEQTEIMMRLKETTQMSNEQAKIKQRMDSAYEKGKEYSSYGFGDLDQGMRDYTVGQEIFDDVDRMSHEEMIAFENGLKGGDGNFEYVTAWRFGEIPEDGRSMNFSEMRKEPGLSVMAASNGMETRDKISALFISLNKKPIIYVSGFVHPHKKGSDGEPLIITPMKIK